MYHSFYCKQCHEEFELQYKALNELGDLLGCECDGKFLECLGQVKEKKHLPKFKDGQGY